MDPEEQILGRLGLTPEQVVGYLYAGLFSALLTAIVAPVRIKAVVDALGGFLATIAVLAMGIAIYVAYRRLLGECLLYPCHHAIHKLVDRLFRRHLGRVTSTTALLAVYGVPFGSRREAYTTIRELLFDAEMRRRLDLAHGEIHVLYITAVGCFCVIIYQIFEVPSRSNWGWLLALAVSYSAAVFADIQQHSLEAQLLRNQGKDSIISFLGRHGFLQDGG